MAKAFITDRLIVPEDADFPKKSLYDAIPRSGVKTMTDIRRKLKVHHKDVTIDGEVMYLRLLAVNARKNVPLKRVLSFENAPVPLSLFTEDGCMTACAKSDFMHKLEELIPGDKVTAIPSCDAVVFDGHASIQMLGAPTSLGNISLRTWLGASLATSYTAALPLQPLMSSRCTLSLTSTWKIASKLKPVQRGVKDKARSTISKEMGLSLKTGSNF